MLPDICRAVTDLPTNVEDCTGKVDSATCTWKQAASHLSCEHFIKDLLHTEVMVRCGLAGLFTPARSLCRPLVQVSEALGWVGVA